MSVPVLSLWRIIASSAVARDGPESVGAFTPTLSHRSAIVGRIPQRAQGSSRDFPDVAGSRSVLPLPRVRTVNEPTSSTSSAAGSADVRPGGRVDCRRRGRIAAQELPAAGGEGRSERSTGWSCPCAPAASSGSSVPNGSGQDHDDPLPARSGSRPPPAGAGCWAPSRPPACPTSSGGSARWWRGPVVNPGLSGRQALTVLATTAGLGRRAVDADLERVGLAERADDLVRGYSLGMRQRLGIGIALLKDPELLILDEPANGLDPAGIREVRELIRRLGAEGRTVFLSSHLLSEVEQVCDEVAIVAHGRTVAQGSVADVLASTRPSAMWVKVADLVGRRGDARAGRARRRARRRPHPGRRRRRGGRARHPRTRGRRPVPDRAAAGRDQPRGRLLRPDRPARGEQRVTRLRGRRAPPDRGPAPRPADRRSSPSSASPWAASPRSCGATRCPSSVYQQRVVEAKARQVAAGGPDRTLPAGPRRRPGAR